MWGQLALLPQGNCLWSWLHRKRLRMSQGTLGIKSVKSYFFYFDENVEWILEQDSCEISFIREIIIIKALVLLDGVHGSYMEVSPVQWWKRSHLKLTITKEVEADEMYMSEIGLGWRDKWEVSLVCQFCSVNANLYVLKSSNVTRKKMYVKKENLWKIFSNFPTATAFRTSTLIVSTGNRSNFIRVFPIISVIHFVPRPYLMIDMVRSWGSLCKGLI